MNAARKTRRVALALLLLVSSRGAVQAGGQAEALIARSLSGAFDADGLRSALTALDTEGPRELIRVLSTRSVSGTARRLDLKHELLIARVVADWPRAELRADLRTLAADDEIDDRARTWGLRILGRCGAPEDIELLAALATPHEARLIGRAVRVAFGEALALILERHPEGSSRLIHAFGRLHPSLVGVALGAMVETGGGQRLDQVVSLLGRTRGADPLVLVAIHDLARGQRSTASADSRSSLRAYLTSSDPTSRKLAMRAVGAVRDHEAIPLLIALLEDSDEAWRQGALQALQTITSQRFRLDPEAWRAWHELELRWWSDESRDCFQDIASGTAAEATQAILSMSARRMRPDELATALLPGLDRSEPEVASLTCAALAQMNSRVALPALVVELEHPDESVRTMAWTALKRITGSNLPLDRTLWERRTKTMLKP